MDAVANQTACLINDEGSRYMRHYDPLPPIVRQRLMDSPFNLCVACVCDKSEMRAWRRYDHANVFSPGKPEITIDDYFATIDSMEYLLKDKEVAGWAA